MRKQRGFFDEDDRLAVLSDFGDPLQRLAQVVDYEGFRAPLEQAMGSTPAGATGRPPFDRVMMFKILILQRLGDLSDARAEYLINDRLSFQRFLGLRLADKVPSATAIRTFRQGLARAGLLDDLLAQHDRQAGATLVIRRSDATDVVIAARPRRRRPSHPPG
jgi:transposase